MSKHSKWAKIKRQKGSEDAKRGNLFTKLSRAITIAARSGADPEMNVRLRLAIEKARGANMPKDTIDRAITRGGGEGMEGAVMEEILYEAFGPGGAALLIESITDNKNRTIAEVKKALTDHGGRIANPKSVLWMFKRHGATLLPEHALSLANEEKEKVQKLVEELDALDDVQQVTTNVADV